MGFFETFYTWIENILEDLGLRGDLLVAGRTLTLVVLVVLIAVLADLWLPSPGSAGKRSW